MEVALTSTEQGRRKYDALADRYEEIYFYVADVGHQLVSFASPTEGARLLDVGAGRGAVARAALARGCRVTAVDASEGMVSRLSAEHPEITAEQQDAGMLEFAEFRRVLAAGGTVALSLERPTVGRMGWLHDLSAEFFGGGSGDPLTADRLDELLMAAGFAAPGVRGHRETAAGSRRVGGTGWSRREFRTRWPRRHRAGVRRHPPPGDR